MVNPPPGDGQADAGHPHSPILKYTHNAAAFRIALIVGEPPEHDRPNRGVTGAVGRDAGLSSKNLHMGTVYVQLRTPSCRF